MSSVQRIPLRSGPGGADYKASIGGATALQTAPLPVVTTPFQQPSAIACSVVVFPITIPSLIAGAMADVAFSIPLGLPTFTLVPTASGLVIAEIDLTTQPAGVLVSISKQIRYSGIAAANAWALPNGTYFAGGQAVGTLQAFSPAGSSAQTVNLICSSIVFGIPSS